MNPQAESLNQVISNNNPVVLELLSKKGKEIFFPKKGILGQTAEAKGVEINATIGAAIEDDGTIMRLGSLAEMVNITPDLTFPYAPSYGRPDLRAKWQQMIKDKNPSLKNDISLPVVTNALTHGLSMVGYLFLDPGDTVITSDLYWGNYNLLFKNAYDANIKTYTCFEGDGLNLQSIKDTLNAGGIGKKFLLLNFPNNPSGYTPTVEEVKALVQIIKESAELGNKIVVACDDAYFGLVYQEGIETESVFAYLADVHENVLAVKIDGSTKEDYVWGFRVGFITYSIKGGSSDLYTALADKTGGAVRGNVSNVSNLSQSLLLKTYESEEYKLQKQQKYEVLQGRYNKVKEVLSTGKYDSYFTAIPYNSGYFMCVQLKEGLEGDKVRKILLEKYSTGLISIGSMLRIAYSCVAEEKIEKMFDNIFAAAKDSEV